MDENNIIRYDRVTIFLHWLIALLVMGLIGMGLYMVSIEHQPGVDVAWYFNLHKSFGLVAASLIVMRVIWRLTHQLAPLPASVPLWQAFIARNIHFLLYICMIVMPLTGFLGASFSKYGVTFFGYAFPAWVEQNRSLSKFFFEVHEITAWMLIALIVLHFFAAMKHLLLNKDGVFQRMWPRA